MKNVYMFYKLRPLLTTEMFLRWQLCGIHTGGLQEAESFADITFGSTLALGGTSHSLDIVYRAQRLASFLVLPEISYLLDGNSDSGPRPRGHVALPFIILAPCWNLWSRQVSPLSEYAKCLAVWKT